MEKIIKKSGKNAEMSSEMIIGIIILIAGFVLVLMIYSSLNTEGLTEREICHNSVVLRATTPEALNFKGFVPLNCKTEKICVRGKNFFNFLNKESGCEEFENVKSVTYLNVKEKEEIEKLIADQIVDCWTMTGEGKVSLFSQFLAENYGFGSIYPSCIVCSRIAFNKETLVKQKVDLSKVDVENYMMTRNLPGTEETYFNYIAGQKGKISTGEMFGINEEDERQIQESANPAEVDNFDEIAILFMQISAPSHGQAAATLGATVFGVGATAPITSLTTIKKVCFSNWYVAIGCTAIAGITVGWQQYNVFLNRNLAAEHCGDISVGSEAREGCSVVRAVSYNAETIDKSCAVIESIS